MRGLNILIVAALWFFIGVPCVAQSSKKASRRERISINEGWRFHKYDKDAAADNLIYDVRPEVTDRNDAKAADSKPTEAVLTTATTNVLKGWVLPSGNQFIKDSAKRHARPAGNPGEDFPFVQSSFDDSGWEPVNLPHDWAIKGPFMQGGNAEVGGGMGRLPSNGVGWYRRRINFTAEDIKKSVFLDIDGAMSYAMVWLNGKLVGGWPYGYNSFRLDLSPFVKSGVNQLAIRVDNPNHSARWYPGAGIYRNVWIVKADPVHVAYSGTYITTTGITKSQAKVSIAVRVQNDSKNDVSVRATTKIFAINASEKLMSGVKAEASSVEVKVAAGAAMEFRDTTVINNPRLWGPPPTQTPNLYKAVTTLVVNGRIVDEYETRFGIRSVEFTSDRGLLVNGERIQIQGVNQHHDLGALGAAFNVRAAERQLQLLREAGCNAIRMAHNPPAPELLALTDRMGFLVFDEIFDSWERKKTPHDFHLIFPEWHEQDLRNFIRRDRNSPSVIIWGIGNEVGEQYSGDEGAAVAQRLYDIAKDEDATRPLTSAMNFAKPDMPLPAVLDIISLNYQGEGIRQSKEFEGTDRIRTPPQYTAFKNKFPQKLILSSETASAFSSRGVYLFPVTPEMSSSVRDGKGGDSKTRHVSSYELHAVDFGSSADKVFSAQDHHPFVAGEFVWTGWDHLGEPTPYYDSRSAYCGFIDLAGFKKDRFYLYQSRWRPDYPMVHILPHWNWQERIGEITPVHVFTSGDEAELFLNGNSLGRRKKLAYQYRLRWDSVKYTPGVLKVISYKAGKKWAEEEIKTTKTAEKISAYTDRKSILSDGVDLAFVTVQIEDIDGLVVPRSNQKIEFSVEGPGVIVATDNGDPTDMTSFTSPVRSAFNGKCLVIVRAIKGKSGPITVRAKSGDLSAGKVIIESASNP